MDENLLELIRKDDIKGNMGFLDEINQMIL